MIIISPTWIAPAVDSFWQHRPAPAPSPSPAAGGVNLQLIVLRVNFGSSKRFFKFKWFFKLFFVSPGKQVIRSVSL